MNKEKTTYKQLYNLCWKILKDEGLVAKMKSTFETNIVRTNISVYEHTKDTEKLIRVFTEKQRGLMQKNLEERVGRFTRSELFVISSIFHDIGKIGYGAENLGCVVREKDGTSAKDHEIASCLYLEDIQKKYRIFEHSEHLYLSLVIRMHSGWNNDLLDYYHSNLRLQDQVSVFARNPIALEVLTYQFLENKTVSTFKTNADFLNTLLQDKQFAKLTNTEFKKLNAYLNSQLSHDKEIILLTNIFSKPWDVNARAFHLGEELGELYDVILKTRGLKDWLENRENVISAMADMYRDMLVLGDFYNVTLNEIQTKAKKDLDSCLTS